MASEEFKVADALPLPKVITVAKKYSEKALLQQKDNDKSTLNK